MGVGPISSNQTLEKASREATGWLIALQEDPDDGAVQARFDGWLASSRENQRAWAEAWHLWKVLGDAQNVSPLSDPIQTDALTAAKASLSHARSRGRFRHFGAAAAGIAAVCLAVVFQPTISIWLAADYYTSTAEVREIQLEDGSTVHLGAGSAIDIAFGSSSRRVRLIAGEAFFEVEPDAERPFQVEAGDVETTVLGTAFDVQLMTDGVAVAVSHGSVGVDALNARHGLDVPLEAGDWVRVDWAGHVERGKDAPELVGGWRSGLLVVKDRPIAEVVDQIRRHYSGTIVLADRGLGRRRVTGVYDLGRPLDALRAVAEVHGANARQITPWVTLVSSF